MSADAVRKYFVKETRWTKRIKSPGKNGHPGEPRKRERFGQKLGIKIKEKNCTPGKLKTRKGDLGKKGYPGGLKPERAVQAKEGMKRTTASSMIICAHNDLDNLRQRPIGSVLFRRQEVRKVLRTYEV
jgi:hypothetical protein